MKKIVFASMLALLGLAAPALAPAIAQEARQDFVLVNRTGYDISEVFVSPSKSDDWEEDVLGDDELENGNSTTIRFKRNTRTCLWDLKVVYSDDDSAAFWREIDLCRVSKITIRYNRSSNTSSADFE